SPRRRGRATPLNWTYFDTERQCRRLDCNKLADTAGITCFAEYGDTFHAGHYFSDNLQPFGTNAIFEWRKACCVTAGTPKTIDKACAYGISNQHEYDWYCSGRNTTTGGLPVPMIMSGASVTNSSAYRRNSSSPPAVQR